MNLESETIFGCIFPLKMYIVLNSSKYTDCICAQQRLEVFDACVVSNGNTVHKLD